MNRFSFDSQYLDNWQKERSFVGRALRDNDSLETIANPNIISPELIDISLIIEYNNILLSDP